MKINLLVIGFMLNFSFAFGQTQFQIKTLGTSYSHNQIEMALNNANLCGFHYIDDKRVLTFDDGAVVELGSSSEVLMDASCFIEKQSNHTNEYWEISNSGHLVRRIKTTQGK